MNVSRYGKTWRVVDAESGTDTTVIKRRPGYGRNKPLVLSSDGLGCAACQTIPDCSHRQTVREREAQR